MARWQRAIWMPLPWDGGHYVGHAPFKIVHHTTEGSTAEGAFATYQQPKHSIPHFTVDAAHIYQHLDTEIAARALQHTGAVETNRSSAIQFELVGFAGRPKDRAALTNAGLLCRWIEATHGVAPVWPSGYPNPPVNGGNPGHHNRSVQNWTTKSGHYGHSHVPDNDHWDPAYTREEADFVMSVGLAAPQLARSVGWRAAGAPPQQVDTPAQLAGPEAAAARVLSRQALLQFQQITQQTIDDEMAARTQAHQEAVAGLRIARAEAEAVGAAAPVAAPLILLAHGDSWFDYPLAGNGLSLKPTDVIAQLGGMGAPAPAILNMSHYGDASTTELSLAKQQRLRDSLRDPANWGASGRPDAILFSGGGNDIAGDQFCICLDYAARGSSGLNATRFADVLGSVAASYLDLFAFRDRYAPGVPVIGHCYDFPIPSGVHPLCAGPWLKPSLDFCGWDVEQGTAIVRTALTRFREQLLALANDRINNFILADTQGTLAASEWANELHPGPAGFAKIAAVVAATLRGQFPGRI
jgi:N-acetylmuramoyl-L-alanine amidase-like protein